MPIRSRRTETRRRPWGLYALFAFAVLAGIGLWAYAPSLPADMLIARYANDRSSFVDVGGVRAHVREEGPADGVPVLLIHGSNASLHVWVDVARDLARTARVISVDLPGHGLTGAWPRDEYTIEAYADFVEVLIDTLRLDRVVIVGHSMGGAVAWTFAATRPNRTLQLVLIDSTGYPRPDGSIPLSLRMARTPLLGDYGIYFKPESAVQRSLADAYADPAIATPDRVRRYAELQRFPGNREATLQRLRLSEPLDPTLLRRMDVPTLILWGGKDRWVPLADGRRFQKDIRGSRLEVFDKLGHNPMEEDPAATAAAIAAFIATAPWPPAPPKAPAETPSEQAVHPSVEPEKD